MSCAILAHGFVVHVRSGVNVRCMSWRRGLTFMCRVAPRQVVLSSCIRSVGGVSGGRGKEHWAGREGRGEYTILWVDMSKAGGQQHHSLWTQNAVRMRIKRHFEFARLTWLHRVCMTHFTILRSVCDM